MTLPGARGGVQVTGRSRSRSTLRERPVGRPGTLKGRNMNRTKTATDPEHTDETAMLIEQFIGHVRRYFQHNQIYEIEGNIASAGAGRAPDGRRLVELDHEKCKARADVLQAGHALTPILKARGHDVRGLLHLLHAFDGGGHARVAQYWPDARVELEDLVLSLLEPDSGGESGDPKAKLPRLQKHDREAWQASLVDGMTQGNIAKKLTRTYPEEGPFKQYQVSRMLDRAKAHADASGLSNLIPDAAEREQAVPVLFRAMESLKIGATGFEPATS